MAQQSPFIDVSSEFQPELTDIQRKQRMAQLLTERGLQAPQGQVVSGRFVAPSPLQYLANMFNVYQGQNLQRTAEEQQLALAQKLRQAEAQDLQRFMEAGRGTPEQTVYGAGEEGPTMTVTPEVKPDYQKQLSIALSSQSPTVRALGTEMLKQGITPQKLGEGEQFVKFNPLSGKYETVAQGAEKYRAPISVDTGTSTVLLDPKTMKPVAQYSKATSGTVQETENGLVLIDPRTGVSRPITDQSGQLLQGGGKPLTESQSNAVAFGMRAKESNKILTDLENKGITNTGLIKGTAQGTLGAVPLIGESLSNLGGALTNWTASQGQQATDQARRNFITAVLRKESGAAISPSEFANEERKYFPQIGDSKETIKQKQEARELAIRALEVQAGKSGARLIEQQVPSENKGWRIKQ